MNPDFIKMQDVTAILDEAIARNSAVKAVIRENIIEVRENTLLTFKEVTNRIMDLNIDLEVAEKMSIHLYELRTNFISKGFISFPQEGNNNGR